MGGERHLWHLNGRDSSKFDYYASGRPRAVEAWECDMDFAFGAATTDGCINTLTSPNQDYMNAVSNTLLGMPSWTSFRTDAFFNTEQH